MQYFSSSCKCVLGIFLGFVITRHLKGVLVYLHFILPPPSSLVCRSYQVYCYFLPICLNSCMPRAFLGQHYKYIHKSNKTHLLLHMLLVFLKIFNKIHIFGRIEVNYFNSDMWDQLRKLRAHTYAYIEMRVFKDGKRTWHSNFVLARKFKLLIKFIANEVIWSLQSFWLHFGSTKDYLSRPNENNGLKRSDVKVYIPWSMLTCPDGYIIRT